MVMFVYQRAVALLACELERRLEKIHVEPGALVQALRTRRPRIPLRRPYPARRRTTAPFFCSTQA